MAFAGLAQVGLGCHRFKAHDPHQPTNALLVHPVTMMQSQEVAHSYHPVEAVLGELQVHQAHQLQV
jgi:hypothetical protein